jgi:hypothetical protein
VTDALVISGGGSSAVATATLLQFGHQLVRLIDELTQCHDRLSSIDRLITRTEIRTTDAPHSASEAERMIDEAILALRLSIRTATLLVAGLGASAEAYGGVERALQQVNQALAARFAYALGYIFPALAGLFAPAVASTAASGALAYAIAPGERRESFQHFLADQNDVLTNPQLVMLVRLAVMGADDFGGGLARVHPAVVGLLGDEGLGLLGLTTSAGLLAGMATPFGALAETPVRVSRVSTVTHQAPAASFAERARRIPQGTAQVRIDRFHAEGREDRFEVYIGGTRDLAPVPTTEPWDMTSNVHALSMGDAGSYRAVEEAMRQAGVTTTSSVQFVGHSQGGLVASALAGSGDYDAQGLFTVGGVVSQGLVPEGVPWLAIEHTDDLVPALGGNRTAPDAVLVRREVFAGEAVPSDSLLPAHELSRYRETASLLDRRGDSRSGGVLDRLNALGDTTESVTTTRYLARRRPAD